MSTHLVKTEPGAYSYDDLVRDKQTVWDGVKNPLALKHLRQVKKGDTVLIYHTGDEKSVVGVAVAASDPFPDPKLDDEKRVVVKLAPKKRLAHPVPLSVFRTDPVLKTADLARLPRLSVMPLTSEQLARVLALAEQGS